MAAPLVNLAANLTVSKLCLGTITFGEQNSSPESLRLLGGAVEAGINFFDSAEMYPVVQRAETQGRSEEYLGRWIRESKTIQHRFGHQAMFPCLGKHNMIQRGSFVQFLWRDNWILLGELLIRIRYVGLSNETPYGVMKFVQVGERSTCRPKIVSLQNAYSLLCRTFDSGLAECCHHEREILGRGIQRQPVQSHHKSSSHAFVLSCLLVASVIFGATKSWQLQEVLDGCKVELTPEVIAEINKVHTRFPNPCP